jgi:valyl-tRNA synthetase
MVARDAPDACDQCAHPELEQDPDVLDTWFSSGLLPFTVFGWDGSGKLTADLAAFYPTQLLVTGFDILFFWVARMIMLGCHFMLDVPMPDGSQRTLKDAVPFREVYIHALVRDANREKMSKTKGNVIDPIGIVTKYGTDAVRFTLASQASPGTDIAFNEARTEGYRAFANKIWNAARFLFMNVERALSAGIAMDLTALPEYLDARAATHGDTLREPGISAFARYLEQYQTLESRWIRASLRDTATSVDGSLKQYRFDEAASSIYEFFWRDFCDWYIEISKLRFDFDDPERFNQCRHSLHTALAVFEASLRLLSPFMPFLTEELFHALYATVGMPIPQGRRSIAQTDYPQSTDFGNVDFNVEDMSFLQNLIVSIRSLRKDFSVPEKQAVPLDIRCGPHEEHLLMANLDIVQRMAKTELPTISRQALSDEELAKGGRHFSWGDIAISYERQVDVAAERERLEKDLARYAKGLAAAEKQLGSESFVAKAPAHIVDGLKRQAAETQALKEKAEAALAAL